MLAVNANGDGPESPESDSVTPGAVTLRSSVVEDDTATLSIVGHTGTWYYKKTAPTPAGTCTEVSSGTMTATLTGLSEGTSYTYKAYSDSGCATELTSATTDADFLTKPGQVSGVVVTPGNTSLSVTWNPLAGTITAYNVQWKSSTQNYNISDRQKTVSSGTTTTITGLTNSTAYTVRIIAYNASGDGIASAEVNGTPAVPGPMLTVVSNTITYNSATLAIDNHSGNWYYKRILPDEGSCSSVINSGTTTVRESLGNWVFTAARESD